ncbi:3-hydroxyacyl-CoA dehydrogenase NAD-binding domain-containing protein [Pseudobacteriovorax antillogorgiicola]|uniref:enoyl-CoA hydratase n=1 Tax=Pseudobacteriovorax antillogorgiicola TaxID=1513793 RepID=A0A1Y6BAL3_9BACT|nr:3-hydroxyacyl-CoA dehydrogenase NAD-binding domain-containing protein [Pseudobacteriovorax antillogorgiicola]TCS59203.1 short chain enoyl-CoA hydratase /3-hydroxyacyl-CoA dehydrogenase [Pseudobacteriovorax antillogorgiicola]SME90604.1 short chain enoyl-CoA hydratase /3-hydroxyacyl-CoA dehydrogenase [Pseudobacteriovorax antillogorgiicola]
MTGYFKVEKIEGDIQVFTFGHADKAVNTLGEEPLRELNDLLDDLIEKKSAQGLIITSDKKDFIVGANIKEIEAFKSAEETRDGSLKMQGILNKLENLDIPTVAAIKGQCLGGGLELALACDWRVAEQSAKLALPEIQLGLIPGSGGTQRLPRLIGIQSALDMILTGKRIEGKKALKMGLVDAACHEKVLFKVAKTYALKKRSQKLKPKTKGLSDNITRFATESNPLGRKVMERKAREMVEKNTKGFYPAPFKALSAVFDGFEKKLEKGLELEAKLFGELSQTKESKSLIHLFHATTHAKKNPFESANKEVFKGEKTSLAGVIGSGFMGAGIATVLADKGVCSRLSDPNPESTSRALSGAYKYFTKKAKRKKIKPFQVDQKMAHISPGLNTNGFESTDVVIEAVFEDVALKQKILKEVEEKGHDRQIFASNTSALPIADIAAQSAHPERVLGMHFFSPVEKMPLLEIVVTDKTAEWATARAFELGQTMGKQIIIVKDSPGFYTTRALAFFMAEAALILVEGNKIEKIDAALTEFGFPVGPMTLMDEVGIDVGSHVLDTMKKAFADRVSIPDGLEAIKESGRLGRKNGKGFYEYHDGKKGDPDEGIYQLVPNWKASSLPTDEIIDRCALVFINESAHCLDEGVLNHPYDGDIGAVFGLGFPPFWGGPFKYVDHMGAKVIVDRLRGLADKYGKRFEPAKALVKMAEEGGKFFPEEN